MTVTVVWTFESSKWIHNQVWLFSCTIKPEDQMTSLNKNKANRQCTSQSVNRVASPHVKRVTSLPGDRANSQFEKGVTRQTNDKVHSQSEDGVTSQTDDRWPVSQWK